MKKYLVALLLMAFIPAVHAADGWARKPAAAYLPERNNNASALRLLEAIKSAGISIFHDEHKETPPCEDGWYGAFIPDAEVIVLCDLRKQTLLHEAMHLVQWCNSGRKSVEAFGWSADNYTLNAVQFASRGQYSGHEFEAEAEAQSFAETTSYLGAAKTVEKYCH